MEHTNALEDALIRRYGYRIKSRPAKGEAIWVKRFRDHGKTHEIIHTHSEAIEKIKQFQEQNRRPGKAKE